MYAELADVYRKMADLLDHAGARMATREALERDALEVHATVLRAKIMEAEEPDIATTPDPRRRPQRGGA